MICSNHYLSSSRLICVSVRIVLPPNSIETTHINIEHSIDMIWLLGNKLCNKYLLYACMCECVCELLFSSTENMLHEMDSFCVFLSVVKISFFPFLSLSRSFLLSLFEIHDHFKQTISFNKNAMDPTIHIISPTILHSILHTMEIMMIIASLIFIAGFLCECGYVDKNAFVCPFKLCQSREWLDIARIEIYHFKFKLLANIPENWNLSCDTESTKNNVHRYAATLPNWLQIVKDNLITLIVNVISYNILSLLILLLLLLHARRYTSYILCVTNV